MDAGEDGLLSEISMRFPKLTFKFWEWWTRDKIYLEIRDMLREILVPLGFSENDSKSFGVVKFQGKPFTIEIMLDYYVPDYSLYISSELSKEGYPIRQLAMNFNSNEYDEEKKSSIRATIKEWIAGAGI